LKIQLEIANAQLTSRLNPALLEDGAAKRLETASKMSLLTSIPDKLLFNPVLAWQELTEAETGGDCEKIAEKIIRQAAFLWITTGDLERTERFVLSETRSLSREIPNETFAALQTILDDNFWQDFLVRAKMHYEQQLPLIVDAAIKAKSEVLNSDKSFSEKISDLYEIESKLNEDLCARYHDYWKWAQSFSSPLENHSASIDDILSKAAATPDLAAKALAELQQKYPDQDLITVFAEILPAEHASFIRNRCTYYVTHLPSASTRPKGNPFGFGM
jgi:hypothetical protein